MTMADTVTIQNEVVDNQRTTFDEETNNNEPNDDINNNVMSEFQGPNCFPEKSVFILIIAMVMITPTLIM